VGFAVTFISTDSVPKGKKGGPVCACEPGFTCPRCRADDRRWLKIDFGDDEKLEEQIEADARRLFSAPLGSGEQPQ
jgi:hypothetical protein